MFRHYFSYLCLFFSLVTSAQKVEYMPFLNALYPEMENNHRLTHDHVSRLSKIHHYYFVQTINDLDIVNVVLSMHINEQGKLVKTNNEFYPAFNAEEYEKLPGIDASQALAFLLNNQNIPHATITPTIDNGQSVIFYDRSWSTDTIKAKLAYLMVKKKIKLIWQIEWHGQEEWYDARVDAMDGSILEKISLTSQCQFGDNDHESHQCGHYEACSILLPNSYNVWPLSVESPIHGSRMLNISPSNTLASPFGWHDTNGVSGAEYTTTKGNNVEAKDDIANDNETTAGSFAQGGANLEFDFPFTPSVSVITNINTSLSNLFYWNNLMHDVWYVYGFDEASGNFQSNNYGRGGTQNDFVYADGLDGSGTNNANFSTPVDGNKPRMQMYKWNVSKGEIISPSAIAGSITAVKANFGAAFYNLTNQAVLAAPLDGCTALTNAADINGKIAMIDRGSCEFGLKCLNAQNAGAIAVIICNNTGSAPTAMPPGVNGASVTIPSVMVSQADCNTIKLNLTNPAVFIKLIGGEYDSGLDNVVIAHEYGHGISIRLTGGAANSSCLSGEEQMGEGWSDWFGLMMTQKPYHTGVIGRGVGNYLTTQDTLGNGIRAYRYSTSMTTNPHTYNSIKTAVAPHGVGSVWCAMLWELTWAMIDKYGFDPDLYTGDGGNNRAMALVIEGLKLQPCMPGFVDGRDAILLADKILYNGENQCLIWKAFAKRGLGFSASQGASRTKSDGVEAFDLPPSCDAVLLLVQSFDNYAAPGDSITYSMLYKNISTGTLTNIVLMDTLPANVQYLSSSNGSAAGQIVTYSPFNLSPGDSVWRQCFVKLIPTAKILVDSIVEDAESATTLFRARNTNLIQPSWEKVSSSVHGGSFSWFARNDTTNNEKYLTLKIPIIPQAMAYMQFWHKYNTETNWDGGLVQVSTDNQLTWQDLGSKMLLNGYNAYINNNASYPAFSGNSTNFINTVINLDAYKNQIIFIRFWLHCDSYDAVDGWYIDDIIFHNTYGTTSTEVFATNNQNKNSRENIYPPIRIVDCTTIYRQNDNGQGTLRRAVACSNAGAKIYEVEELLDDTLELTSSPILVDKSIQLMNQDSTIMYIKSYHDQPAFILSNNSNILIHALDINKINPSAQPTLVNQGANLTLENSMIKLISASSVNAVSNQSGEVTIRGNTHIKKE